MKPTLFFAAFFLSTVAIGAASAQTYQWKDGSGRTVISDTPPAGGTKATAQVGSDVPPAAPAEQKSIAEKSLDFNKRQQEAREKAEQQSKEAAEASKRRDNCDRARRNLKLLESDQAVSRLDDKGEGQLLNDKQRRQEIERARQMMQEACK